MLQIDPSKVCYLIVKARQFFAKVEAVEPDPGSNPLDDEMRGVLEDYDDDPVLDEIKAFMDGLNEDEEVDLVALMWLGREGSNLDDWPGIRTEAARAHNEHTFNYLLGTPLLADYVAEGLERHGYSC